jgi:signal transduction histidine kinase
LATNALIAAIALHLYYIYMRYYVGSIILLITAVLLFNHTLHDYLPTKIEQTTTRLKIINSETDKDIHLYFRQLTSKLNHFSKQQNTQNAIIKFNRAIATFDPKIAASFEDVDRFYRKKYMPWISEIALRDVDLEGASQSEKEQTLQEVKQRLQVSKGKFTDHNDSILTKLQNRYQLNNHYYLGKYSLFLGDTPLTKGIDPNLAQYDLAHQRFHPYFFKNTEDFDLHDIILITPVAGNKQVGRVIYTVGKEPDFGQRLTGTSFEASWPAKIYHQLVRSSNPDQIVISDLASYLPSGQRPSLFIAKGVYRHGRFLGVVVFQIERKRIQQLLNYHRQQLVEQAGGLSNTIITNSRHQVVAGGAYHKWFQLEHLGNQLEHIPIDEQGVKNRIENHQRQLVSLVYRPLDLELNSTNIVSYFKGRLITELSYHALLKSTHARVAGVVIPHWLPWLLLLLTLLTLRVELKRNGVPFISNTHLLLDHVKNVILSWWLTNFGSRDSIKRTAKMGGGVISLLLVVTIIYSWLVIDKSDDIVNSQIAAQVQRRSLAMINKTTYQSNYNLSNYLFGFMDKEEFDQAVIYSEFQAEKELNSLQLIGSSGDTVKNEFDQLYSLRHKLLADRSTLVSLVEHVRALTAQFQQGVKAVATGVQSDLSLKINQENKLQRVDRLTVQATGGKLLHLQGWLMLIDQKESPELFVNVSRQIVTVLQDWSGLISRLSITAKQQILWIKKIDQLKSQYNLLVVKIEQLAPQFKIYNYTLKILNRSVENYLKRVGVEFGPYTKLAIRSAHQRVVVLPIVGFGSPLDESHDLTIGGDLTNEEMLEVEERHRKQDSSQLTALISTVDQKQKQLQLLLGYNFQSLLQGAHREQKNTTFVLLGEWLLAISRPNNDHYQKVAANLLQALSRLTHNEIVSETSWSEVVTVVSKVDTLYQTQHSELKRYLSTMTLEIDQLNWLGEQQNVISIASILGQFRSWIDNRAEIGLYLIMFFSLYLLLWIYFRSRGAIAGIDNYATIISNFMLNDLKIDEIKSTSGLPTELLNVVPVIEEYQSTTTRELQAQIDVLAGINSEQQASVDLFDHIAVALVAVDARGKIIELNSYFNQTFAPSFTRQQIIGEHLYLVGDGVLSDSRLSHQMRDLLTKGQIDSINREVVDKIQVEFVAEEITTFAVKMTEVAVDDDSSKNPTSSLIENEFEDERNNLKFEEIKYFIKNFTLKRLPRIIHHQKFRMITSGDKFKVITLNAVPFQSPISLPQFGEVKYGVLLTFTDTTSIDQLRAMTKLMPDRKQLKTKLDLIKDHKVAIFDRQHQLVMCNQQYLQAYQQISGQTTTIDLEKGVIDGQGNRLYCYQVSHQSSVPCWEIKDVSSTVYGSCEEHGCPIRDLGYAASCSGQHKHLEVDGTLCRYRFTYSPFMDQKWDELFLETIFPVEQQCQLEEQLNEGEFLSESELKQFPDGLIILNHQGVIHYHNEQAANILGVMGIEQALVGDTLSSYLYEEQKQHVLIEFQDITEEEALRQKSQQLQHDEAQLAYQAGIAEMGTNVLHNIGNGISSVLTQSEVLSKEVTALGKMAKLLESGRSEQEREKLQTALVLAAGSLRKIEQQSLGEPIRKITDGINHIAEIIRIQQISAQQGGVDHITLFSLRSLIENVIKLQIDALNRRSITITHDISSEVDELKMSEIGLIQLLSNLIKNCQEAINVRRDKEQVDGKIWIKVWPGIHEDFTISVEDNGCGIPANKLEKIFTHGFSTKNRGSGYGLHSVATFVQSIGGTIKATSDGVNQGAQIVINLPLNIEG